MLRLHDCVGTDRDVTQDTHKIKRDGGLRVGALKPMALDVGGVVVMCQARGTTRYLAMDICSVLTRPSLHPRVNALVSVSPPALVLEISKLEKTTGCCLFIEDTLFVYSLSAALQLDS